MASYRFGGLAVALGIGSAIIAGHGVASADSSDGSAASDSSSTNSSTTDASTGDAPDTTTGRIDTEDSDATGDESPSATSNADAQDEAPTRKKRSNRARLSEAESPSGVDSPRAASDSRGDRVSGETPEVPNGSDDDAPPAADVPPPAAAPAVTVTTVMAPTQPAEPAVEEHPVEEATVIVSRTTSALLTAVPGDGPTSPAETMALWTLTAAARRELSKAETDVERPAEPVTTSLIEAAAPSVVAMEQTPPLAFLQQVPILGPVVITPIIAALHQIPFLSDVIHPFVGFPVQWNLPAGAPKPRDVKVISADGTAIYVHFMPARGLEAGQKAPTVLHGPGLGLPGATNLDGTILDDVLTDALGMMSVGTLRQAGYNVVTWDPRGEWNSGGRLELNAAEFEGRDMSAIISWLATQPGVRLDDVGDPRIGMVGVSYGGGIQPVTAANDRRVDAIVPAITYHNLITSLYKGAAFKSSWANLLSAVLTLTLAQTNPRILPATIYGDLTGQVSPGDQALLSSRNPVVGGIKVPTLLIQGTVDTLFSLQEADETARILLANGVTTKVVWFCGGHGLCANNPFDLRDGALIERRTIEWLDRYVEGDLSVSTGPQFEWVDQRGDWHSSDTYPVSKGSSIVASLGDGATLPLIPYFGGSGIPFVPFALPALNAINVSVPQANSMTYLVGAPRLTLTYSGTGTGMSRHVFAQLVDNTTGLVLGSLATPIPVTLDGTTRTVIVDLEPVAHTLRAGESMTLQLVAAAGLYERIMPSLGVLTVSGLQVAVPTAVISSATTPLTTAA